MSAGLCRRLGSAELGAVRGFALVEQQVVRFTFDRLAGLEAEGSGAWAPPAARRLSPALAGLDVIAGRVLGRAAVDQSRMKRLSDLHSDYIVRFHQT